MYFDCASGDRFARLFVSPATISASRSPEAIVEYRFWTSFGVLPEVIVRVPRRYWTIEQRSAWRRDAAQPDCPKVIPGLIDRLLLHDDQESVLCPVAYSGECC